MFVPKTLNKRKLQ